MTTIWTDHIDARFHEVPNNPLEKDYYPPWNKLLNFLFPPDSPFTVAPRSYPVRDLQSLDFYVEYHILRENVVIFVQEIKCGPRLDQLGARQEADDQLRRRLLERTEQCPLPTLRAVSAFGTHMCFYEAQHVEGGIAILPRRIHNTNPDIYEDVAPRSRWNYDVMQLPGAQELRDVVQTIKDECHLLGLCIF